MTTLTQRIKSRALEFGFDAARIAPAEPGEHLPFYLDWLAAGYHGEQAYLARPDRLARRRDLQVILPGVRSLVVVAAHYWPGPPLSDRDQPDRGRISCYALGSDYHRVMVPMLNRLLAFIQAEANRPVRGRSYVDTGPLLERDHAARAGLGFIGKNCSLIRPRDGSWLFLGVLLIDYSLEADEPGPFPTCGTCTRCQLACPTEAFVRPFTLDSRRCISYWTTALKGSIPREWRSLMGNRIFGCDECQSVCPWNRFARPSVLLSGDQDGPVNPAPPLSELIGLAERGFQARYGHTAIGHIGRERFLRNVAVAIGNWGAPEAVPALTAALADPSELVREHVAWALGQIGTGQARLALARALAKEPEAAVRAELEATLESR